MKHKVRKMENHCGFLPAMKNIPKETELTVKNAQQNKILAKGNYVEVNYLIVFLLFISSFPLCIYFASEGHLLLAIVSTLPSFGICITQSVQIVEYDYDENTSEIIDHKHYIPVPEFIYKWIKK